MKVGAGGLQSQITNDALKQQRPSGNIERLATEPPGEVGLTVTAPSRQEVIRAVEMLNHSALLYNQPYEYRFREKDKKMTVQVIKKRFGEQYREISPERAIELAEATTSGRGGLFDVEV